MLKSIFRLLIVFLLQMPQLKAQQLLLSSDLANPLYNPAYLNAEQTYFGTLGIYKQWLTMPGAPFSAYFTGGTNTKFGTLAISGRNTGKGVLNRIETSAQWATSIPTGATSQIRFGFAAGFTKSSVVQSKVLTQLPDPIITENTTISKGSPLFAAGAVYNFQKWNFDAAISELSFENEAQLFAVKAAASYTLNSLTENLTLVPEISAYINKLQQTDIRLGISANYKKTLCGMLAISSQGGIIIGIGTNLSNLSVRYANLFNLNNVAGNLGGTHEFAVGGGFKKQKTIIIIPPDPIIDSTLLVNNSKQNNDSIKNNAVVISTIKTDTIIKTDKTRVLKGILTDQTTGKPIGGLVEVFDNSSNTVIASTNSDPMSGKYKLQVPLNKNLGLAVKVKDKMFHSENFTFAETDTTDFEMPTIALQPLLPGTKIILNNIFFQSGCDTPTAESYAEFDRLIQLLNEHSNLRIKITGHTDNTGTLELNQTISTNRAREVVNYLVSKGIDKSRLEFEGFADTQPIADNTTEAGKDKNRRVEAEIVK